METQTYETRALSARMQQLGLLENPFSTYPDARYFHPCAEHSTLYHKLLRTGLGTAGTHLAIVQGGPGTGKTTLARRLAAGFPYAITPVVESVYIDRETQNARTLLVQIAHSLELGTFRSLSERMDVIRNRLLRLARDNRGLVLVVDSEISASAFGALLEIMQMGSHMHTRLPVRVIVFGPGGLFSMVEKAAKDYPMVQHTLSNLSYNSASAVLEGRTRMAGRSAPLFDSMALHQTVEYSDGHPGRLIRIADLAFQQLLNSTENFIDVSFVQNALREIDQDDQEIGPGPRQGTYLP